MSHHFNLNYGIRMKKADKLLPTVKTSTINCLTFMIFFPPINLVYNIWSKTPNTLFYLFTLNIARKAPLFMEFSRQEY